MNPKVASVLELYEAREADERQAFHQFTHDQYLEQRDSMLLGIGPDAGKFLNTLVRAHRPRTIVEVGTAFGYSTLWLAEAAAAVGAHLTSYELMPEKQAYAADMIRKAGLEATVTFLAEDPVETSSNPGLPIDFLLIDAWKDRYIPIFDALLPRLSSPAIVCADNMLFPAYQIEAANTYIRHVHATPGAQSLTIPIGSGIEFTLLTETRYTLPTTSATSPHR